MLTRSSPNLLAIEKLTFLVTDTFFLPPLDRLPFNCQISLDLQRHDFQLGARPQTLQLPINCIELQKLKLHEGHLAAIRGRLRGRGRFYVVRARVSLWLHKNFNQQHLLKNCIAIPQ